MGKDRNVVIVNSDDVNDNQEYWCKYHISRNVDGVNRLKHEYTVYKHIFDNGGSYLIADKFDIKRLSTLADMTWEDTMFALLTSNEGMPLDLYADIYDEYDELTPKAIKIIDQIDKELKTFNVRHNDLEPRNIIVKHINDSVEYKVIDFEDAEIIA